ncbi:hypothetical protein [Methanobacterium petrolearium]|uniref:hypothetical protein n=1 Tax=Methanobacterium petrolearium TaxID=710190 RepID=UPI0030816867|nr:hypothetical protein GCM10025861_16520 [Methanobacterium petrolearium]
MNEKYQNSIIISKNPKNVIYNNEFELLGLYRWINLKLDEFKELNSIIEDTVKKLNETNLGTMLKKSIVISEKFLPVEMLELEFKYVRVSLEDFDSVCWENVGFLSDIYENIKEKIDEIKFIKKTSNEKMDSILNLKNIQFNENVQNKMLSLTKENQTIQEQMLSLTEYNKKIQIMVMILSACVIIFTIIQVYLSYQTLINNNQTSLVAMIISWI